MIIENKIIEHYYIIDEFFQRNLTLKQTKA